MKAGERVYLWETQLFKDWLKASGLTWPVGDTEGQDSIIARWIREGMEQAASPREQNAAVDPVIHGVAEIFVDELIAELPALVTAALSPSDRATWRLQLIHRAAQAMQQAIEAELEAIRQEALSGPRRETGR